MQNWNQMYGEPIHHSQHERERNLKHGGEYLRFNTILELPVLDRTTTCADGGLDGQMQEVD